MFASRKGWRALNKTPAEAGVWGWVKIGTAATGCKNSRLQLHDATLFFCRFLLFHVMVDVHHVVVLLEALD